MDIKLGEKLNTQSAFSRDAIHVAVAPVKAGEKLQPGQRVLVTGGEAFGVSAMLPAHAIGIVDPFLTAPVLAGEKFWMVMVPGTVENLRHDWDHPSLAKTVSFEEYDPHQEDEEDDGCKGC